MQRYRLTFYGGAPDELYINVDRARCRLLQEYFRKDAKPDEVVGEILSIIYFGRCKTGFISFYEN